MIPVGIAFAFSFFLIDTPRWLASQGRNEEAAAALSRLRKLDVDDHALHTELSDIQAQVSSRAADLAHTNVLYSVRELLTIATYRKRFLLVIAFHVIAQWTGGNAITFYVSTIFEATGVGSQGTALISSGGYGIVKLVFTILFAVVMIDLIGRRPCFLTGLLLQFIAHVYLAAYFANPIKAHTKSADNGAIAMVFVYAVGWSIGLCTIPYIYGSEIFPTRVRNVAYASTMWLHWFLQYAVVKALPPMFVAFNKWGAYVLFASVCFVGFVLLGVCAPETNGVPMEYMDALFSARWYMGWKAKRPDALGDPFIDRGVVSDSTDDLEALEDVHRGKD